MQKFFLHLTLASLMILSTLSVNAAGSPTDTFTQVEDRARAYVTITYHQELRSTTIKVRFSRQTIDKDEIVLLALGVDESLKTLADSEVVDEVGNHTAHLTGWFVVHSRGKELWIAALMEEGKEEAVVEVQVPGLQGKLPGPQSLYELAISKVEGTIEKEIHRYRLFNYSRLETVEAKLPSWAVVTNDSLSLGNMNYQLKLNSAGVFRIEYEREKWFLDFVQRNLWQGLFFMFCLVFGIAIKSLAKSDRSKRWAIRTIWFLSISAGLIALLKFLNIAPVSYRDAFILSFPFLLASIGFLCSLSSPVSELVLRFANKG